MVARNRLGELDPDVQESIRRYIKEEHIKKRNKLIKKIIKKASERK